MHSIFKVRDHVTSQIVELLSSASLGTNGAIYRHLDTEKRIQEIDNPLYLSIEKGENVLGNITFCKRKDHWYVRFFAFSKGFQSKGKRKSKASKDNLLRVELDRFFEKGFEGEYDDPVVSYYAYIDPKNEKSLWMSENFGFKKIGTIATQTFSRAYPKKSHRIEKMTEWDEIRPLIFEQFSEYNYFFDAQVQKPPLYVIKNDTGEIIAYAKTNLANWEIIRLPGRMGKWLTKAIPFIPILNKIIRPKKHRFIVPDTVYVKNNDPLLLNELFQGILFEEKENLIIWWVDGNDSLYHSISRKVRWGLLHKIIDINWVNLVQKTKSGSKNCANTKQPYYTSGIDFI